MTNIEVSFGENECGEEMKVHIGLTRSGKIVLTTQNFGDDMVWLDKKKAMEFISGMQQALTVSESLRDNQ